MPPTIIWWRHSVSFGFPYQVVYCSSGTHQIPEGFYQHWRYLGINPMLSQYPHIRIIYRVPDGYWSAWCDVCLENHTSPANIATCLECHNFQDPVSAFSGGTTSSFPHPVGAQVLVAPPFPGWEHTGIPSHDSDLARLNFHSGFQDLGFMADPHSPVGPPPPTHWSLLPDFPGEFEQQHPRRGTPGHTPAASSGYMSHSSSSVTFGPTDSPE